MLTQLASELASRLVRAVYARTFPGNKNNYYLWEIAHRLRHATKTIRIITTNGECLSSWPLQLRDDLGSYSELFVGSRDFFRSTMLPPEDEFKSKFPFVGELYNEEFGSVDAEFYYAMIRRHRPQLILEVGSGHSTFFALRALKMNRKGTLVSIDPQPRRALPPSVKQMRKRVQDIDISVFDSLGKDDILFFDSSHTREEVQYHLEIILPRLRRGVLIQHHDVFYPYTPRYGEEEALLEFYSQNPESFRVLASLAYLHHDDSQVIEALVPSFGWNMRRSPGSMWVKKIVDSSRAVSLCLGQTEPGGNPTPLGTA